MRMRTAITRAVEEIRVQYGIHESMLSANESDRTIVISTPKTRKTIIVKELTPKDKIKSAIRRELKSDKVLRVTSFETK
jgi:hypothetical protein